MLETKMANKAGKLYIRNKVGYRKPPKRLADLPEGETFVLFWYEGKKKKAKAVGRFADRAQTALVNKEAALRRATVAAVSFSPAIRLQRAVRSGRLPNRGRWAAEAAALRISA
jgi:hypothetical protein